MRVIFIGQNPSKMNIRREIPFLGTKSYKNLQEWIKIMKLKEEECFFYNASQKVGKVSFEDVDKGLMLWITNEICDKNTAVITLGKYAFNAFKKYLSESQNKYPETWFSLPHPSPLNRKLNNKENLYKELKMCKDFINSKIKE